MKNNLLLVVFTFLLFSIACDDHDHEHEHADEINLEEVRAELQAMEDAYAEGENNNDAEAVVAYYADDAHNLPYNQPTVKGKAAILERIKADMAADTSNTTIAFEVVDVFAAGDLAVEVGKSTSRDADGNVVSTGKYISVFEKRDGKYVCIRDIWNQDAAE